MSNPLEWKYAAQVGLLVSTATSREMDGTLAWALIGAVILGGAFYFDRVLR